MLVFLNHGRPLETNFALKIETMNECSILMILYLLLCFSEFQPDVETRNTLGFAYIGLIGAFATVHIGFLFYFTASAIPS